VSSNILLCLPYHLAQATMQCMVAARGDVLSQLRRGVLEYCVLAALRDGEHYGFELVKTLAEADGLLTSEGTIYPLLARLRRDGAVETSWRESAAGPPRRYYSLTTNGSDALKRFTRDWARFRDAVDQVLMNDGAK
jgi:PadR family transcriptional regulator, regulatory protein PadR